MTFDWQNNPDLEFRTLRTHFTKDFLNPDYPEKSKDTHLKIQQLGSSFHAFTDNGFEDIDRELPNYNFPEGLELIKAKDKHFVLDLPSWGEARIEEGGKVVRVYDRKGVSIFRYKDLFVIGKDKKPFKVVDKDGVKCREADTKDDVKDAEAILLHNRVERSDDAEEASWEIEKGKLYVKVPALSKNIYPLKVYDATDTASVNNKDAYFYNAYSSNNYGASVEIRLTAQTGGFVSRGVIKFTLSSGSGTISSIKLFLYKYFDYFSDVGSVRVHELTGTGGSNWTEAGATWNKYDGTNNWTAAGGDFSSTIVDTTNDPGLGVYQYVSWNLGVGATNPISGLTWGSTVNLLLKFTSEESSPQKYQCYYSKENASNKPYIEITYTPSSTNWEKTLTESATFTASFIKGAQRILSENLSFTDVLAKVRGISRVLSESSSFAATLTRGIGKIWNEAASFGDTLVKGTGKILIELTESVSFADSLTRSAGKIFLESKTFTASMIRDLAKTFSESASFADNLAKGAGKILAEAVSFSDILIRSTQKIFAETTNFNDQCFRIISRTLGETAGFSATIIRSAARTLNETISFSAALSKGIVKTFSGTAVFGATFLRSISRTFAEIPHFAAVITRSVSRIFSETATFAASLIKSPVKTLTGSATFTDSIRRSIARTLTESVGFIASIRLYLNGLTAGIWARTKRTKDSWTKTGREL